MSGKGKRQEGEAWVDEVRNRDGSIRKSVKVIKGGRTVFGNQSDLAAWEKRGKQPPAPAKKKDLSDDTPDKKPPTGATAAKGGNGDQSGKNGSAPPPKKTKETKETSSAAEKPPKTPKPKGPQTGMLAKLNQEAEKLLRENKQ